MGNDLFGSEMKLFKELSSKLDKSTIKTSIEDRICFAYDGTNRRFLPDVVIDIKDATEIPIILEFANQNKIPVIPRGAGTGLTGGTLPIKAGIVLNLSLLDKIVLIDTDRKIGIVEPGVVTFAFQTEAEKRGLFYPPDPGSQKTCTIGGNVLENAGGLRCVKYGVTRNYVAGLETYLPTGEILLLGELNPNSTPFDESLIEIIIASEGTLAIVSRIALRLLDKPQSIYTILATFSNVSDTVATVNRIFLNDVIPCTLEFIDSSTLKVINDYRPIDFSLDNSVLLIEVDGDKEIISKQIEVIEQICRKGNATSIRKEIEPEKRDNLWTLRRAISPSLVRVSPTKVNEDIVVPKSKLPQIMEDINRIAEKYDLPILTFGHAGDGNLHVNIMSDKRNPKLMEKAQNAAKELFECTIKLGGTLSGEHGIGTSKLPFVDMIFSQDEIDFQKKIKKAFDPNNILNPNKVFL